MLSAIPAEMVSQVIDAVDALPAAGQYEFFKNELLNIHQLSDYEKLDMLVKMEPMGGRKPSQLLHAMLEFCPQGMERHLSFHYFFMQRLPQALRTQLGEVRWYSLGTPAPSLSEQTADRHQAVEVMGASLLCDTLTGIPRPLIPTEDRKAKFDAFHNLAHASTRATRRLIGARAVWRGMNSDVASWVRDCQQCCRGKVTGQPAAPVQPIHVPGKRFSHVNLVGPLPVAEDGSTYVFTMVDRCSCWLEAVLLRNIEAKTCVEAFINTWVAHYGVPEAVTTDRERQFTSALWEGLCQNLQINQISTTAYHPQSNG